MAQRRTRTQPRFAPAADDLKGLRQELDLADAAATELDVVAGVFATGAAPAGLGADQRMQFAQRGDRAVVQVLAEHERAHEVLERSALRRELRVGGEHRRRHDAALEPGETFPFAAQANQVLLEHVVRYDQRARIAVGPQPHVDAKHESVGGHLGQRRDHAATESLEEFLIGERPSDFGLAVGGTRRSVLVVDEHEVDVGRDVEFAATELAHADDQQVLWHTVGAERHAVRARQLARVQ